MNILVCYNPLSKNIYGSKNADEEGYAYVTAQKAESPDAFDWFECPPVETLEGQVIGFDENGVPIGLFEEVEPVETMLVFYNDDNLVTHTCQVFAQEAKDAHYAHAIFEPTYRFIEVPSSQVGSPAEHYLTDLGEGLQLMTRPSMEIEVSAYEIALGGSVEMTNLPMPSKVFIDHVEFDVADGDLTFTPETIGTYAVRVVANPYLDDNMEIIVT